MSDVLCPCCRAVMRRGDPEEPRFCWDCGLYAGDDPAECDLHARQA